MFEAFGSHPIDGNRVEFKVFYPGPGLVHRGGDPRVQSIAVYGDFQTHFGAGAWSPASAVSLQPAVHSEGALYKAVVGPLPEGFYQYKYLVEFDNGERRIVGDPCARYSGDIHENAAFVIGGSTPQQNAVPPLSRRLPLRELVIYELCIDDFAAKLSGDAAPIDRVTSRLDEIQSLGCVAIETLPWTAWPGDSFSWGYNPFMYFSVENRLVNDPGQPSEKLSRLKRFIRECHVRGLHVIMDGVFNHVEKGTGSRGFAYYWLYRDGEECPFVGSYGGGGFLDDLDFSNPCTQQFILDVCLYWMKVFQVDGLRLDYTKGFYLPNQSAHGLARLIADVLSEAARMPTGDFSVTIEHLEGYGAIDVANKVQATSCWYDELHWRCRDYLKGGYVDGRIMRALNANKDFEPGRAPTIYIENHDHSQVACNAGGRAQWFRAQPHAIALFTCPGAVLIHAGQEFAEDYWLPESAEESSTQRRVMPRPTNWQLSGDDVGSWMRWLYARLISIRRAHPCLSGPYFYPDAWDDSWSRPNAEGYGVDVLKQVVIYHRWGQARDGRLERFIVVLNFSPWTQYADVPFSDNGEWEDLLSGWKVQVRDWRLDNQGVGSHWGHIFYRKD